MYLIGQKGIVIAGMQGDSDDACSKLCMTPITLQSIVRVEIRTIRMRMRKLIDLEY